MRKKTNNVNEETEIKQKRRKQGIENNELNKGVEIAKKAIKKEKIQRQKKIKEIKKEQSEIKPRIKKVIKYILFCIFAVIVFLLIKYRHIIGITFCKEITEEDSIVIEMTTADNKIYAYQNEILVYSKGKLITYSRYGKKTWEYTFDETFIPEISTSGKYIQVVNKDSGYVYVFDNKYESCREQIKGNIKRASINSKGQSVIYYSKEGIKSNISVYDKKGNEKYKITLNDENIAKVDLSDNGRFVVLYEIDTQGISANSIIKIVDLNKSTEIKTALEISNDIIYDVILKDSKLHILTSNKVYIYNILANSKKEYDISDKNISNISIDASGVSYIYKEISDENNTLVVLNNMYDTIGEYKFNENVKYFNYYNSLAYVICNKELNIYNRWGMNIKNFTATSVITNPVIFNNGKNIALNYSNRIVIIGI